VLVQAGASGTGPRRRGTLGRDRLHRADDVSKQAKEFYADVMTRLPRFGRTPDEVRVMPGFYPVVAATVSEAQEKFDYLQFADPGAGRHFRARAHDRRARSRQAAARRPGARDARHQTARSAANACCSSRPSATKLTFWQLCLANAGPARGHVLSIGTPSQVADEMEHWFNGRRRRRLQT